jgi:hypothetical protein
MNPIIERLLDADPFQAAGFILMMAACIAGIAFCIAMTAQQVLDYRRHKARMQGHKRRLQRMRRNMFPYLTR